VSVDLFLPNGEQRTVHEEFTLPRHVLNNLTATRSAAPVAVPPKCGRWFVRRNAACGDNREAGSISGWSGNLPSIPKPGQRPRIISDDNHEKAIQCSEGG
jgi:hypothetical protein